MINHDRAEKIDWHIYNHTFDTAEQRVEWITSQLDEAAGIVKELITEPTTNVSLTTCNLIIERIRAMTFTVNKEL